jgi:Bacterial Ig domain
VLLLSQGLFVLRLIGLAEAIQPEIEYKTPPIVTINSPVNNETFSGDTVTLRFTVTKPDGWLVHGGYAAQQILKSVNYQLDGEFSDQIIVNSTLEVPFNYSLNLTNLTDGIHALRVYAYASGWVIQMNGFYEYEVPINSSSPMVYFFTVSEQNPSPTPTMPNMGPTSPPSHPDFYLDIVYWAILLSVIIVVGIVLWLYFRKHQKDKSP